MNVYSHVSVQVFKFLVLIYFVFQLKMNKNQPCTLLCEGGKGVTMDEKQSKLLAQRIKQAYSVHL